MIDLHCHILPGIDDGPDTIDDALALARAAVAAGTRTIVATSHVSPRIRTPRQPIALAVAALNAAADRARSRSTCSRAARSRSSIVDALARAS